MSRITSGGINKVLTEASERWQDRHGGERPPGAARVEGANNDSPDNILADRDLRMTAIELEAEEARFQASDEAARVFVEAYSFLIEFIFSEGPHPGIVMRRLYMLVKKYRPELIWDMGYRQLAKLLGESHGSMEFRISVLDEYAQKSLGVTGVKMGWQKTGTACETLSNAQMGNSNRLGGKKSGKQKAKNHKSKT